MLLTTVPTPRRHRNLAAVDQMEATQVTSRNLDRGTLPFLPFSREGPHASEAVQTWFDDTRTDDCGWNTSAIEEYWQYGEV